MPIWACRMTDIGPKIQMCISCVFHMGFMRIWAVAVFAGSAAQAGAWEEFEARCLVPMENVEASDVSGLMSRGKTSETVPFGRYYSDADWDFIVLTSGDGSWCGVILGDPSERNLANIAPLAEAWIQTGISSERYFELSTSDHRRHFQSTEWREPRIEVSVRVNMNGIENGEAVLIAKETDLES